MRRPDRMRPVRRRCDAGYVTAETAVVAPSLVLLVAMLLWGVTAAAGLVQSVDGARAGARAAARGESPQAMREAARSVAPSGAEVHLVREGALLRVRVVARAPGPGPLALPLEAEAVALAEDSLAAQLPAGASGGVR
jgi:hypothetical protein